MDPNKPLKESSPDNLQTGGPCGRTETADYNFPQNSAGGVLPPVIQATYKQGDIIEVAVNILANHLGHLEFSACPMGSNEPTDACFANHCLEFVSDPLYGAPKDTTFKYRAYLPPPDWSGLIADTSHPSFPGTLV